MSKRDAYDYLRKQLDAFQSSNNSLDKTDHSKAEGRQQVIDQMKQKLAATPFWQQGNREEDAKTASGSPSGVAAKTNATLTQMSGDVVKNAKDLLNSHATLPDVDGWEKKYGEGLGLIRAQHDADVAKREADPLRASLKLLAEGKGPAADAARAQLTAGLDASNAQAMSVANSARGGAGASALANRTAMMQAGQNNQQAGNAAAGLMAQMQAGAYNNLTNIYGTDTQANTAYGNSLTSYIQGGNTDRRGLLTDTAKIDSDYNLGKYNGYFQGVNTAGGLLTGGQTGVVNAYNAGTGRQNANTSAAQQHSEGTVNDIKAIGGGVQAAGGAFDFANRVYDKFKDPNGTDQIRRDIQKIPIQ
jgi:hypothetical protein